MGVLRGLHAPPFLKGSGHDCFMDALGHIVQVLGVNATHVDLPVWKEVDVLLLG